MEIPRGRCRESCRAEQIRRWLGREAANRGCNVELREEIRFTTVDFAWLAIDLDSNPEIHGECSRNFPVIQGKEIGSVCTLPHIGNSSNHAGEENV